MIPRNIYNQNWFNQQFVIHENDGFHDYLECYEIVILQRETKRMQFHHQTSQLQYRSVLVDYLRNCINDYFLSSYCLHLAVYLLDGIMDKKIISPYYLYLFANVCLNIAVKCEETQVKVLNTSRLNKRTKSNFSVFEYTITELLILKMFDWDLLVPTAVHFVQFYMIRVINEEDLVNKKLKNVTKLTYRIKRMVSECLYNILDDYHYVNNFPPSQQAAAIIFAARQAMGLAGWNRKLQSYTGYYEKQLLQPLDILFRNNNFCGICADTPKETVLKANL